MTRGATVKGTVCLYRPPADGGLRLPHGFHRQRVNPAVTRLVKAQGIGNVLLELDRRNYPTPAA